MKILLISYYFAPQNLIGAVRPTKLAKYLTRMGHEVTVICGLGHDGKVDQTLARDLKELGDVRLLQEWNPLRKLRMKKQSVKQAAPSAPAAAPQPAMRKSGLKKLVAVLMDQTYILLRWLADRSFLHLGLRELRRLSGPYDVVFSSYSPVSVHELASKAKRKGLARKWIADFRDEVDYPFACQKKQKDRFMAMLRREADILCSVSQGVLEIMGFDDVGRVLHNGFDREDLPGLKVEKQPGMLRCVYCGQLNMGRKGVPDRDLTPLFRALSVLMEQGAINREEIRLVYAGTEGERWREYAASCGLESCVEDHGLVSREESLALQQGADMLLMGSVHTWEQRGILTGKLFEYMMMDKPIICCMGGDLPNSAVKQVLEETGTGFCWEAACRETDDAALLSYTRELVMRWKNGEEQLLDTQGSNADAYAYPGLAKVLEGWMSE